MVEQMAPQVTSHGGIMASGRGARLAEMGPSKPMIEVHGKPLIDFSLDQMATAGIKHMTVTARSHDRALRRHLAGVARSRRFETFEVLTVESEQGACAAIHALVEHAGDVPQLLSAADVIARPDQYEWLSWFASRARPGEILSCLGTAYLYPDDPARTTFDADQTDEKWVFIEDTGQHCGVDSIEVSDFGADGRRSLLTFAGVRWLNSTARAAMTAVSPTYRLYNTLPDSEYVPVSESQLERELLGQGQLALEIAGAINVNTPADLRRAETAVARYWGPMPEHDTKTID